MPKGFIYAGPEVIKTDRAYSLAIQKGPAHDPERYFGAGVAFGVPEAVSEMWYVLYRYGAQRYLNCIFIDSDDEIPGCSWPG